MSFKQIESIWATQRPADTRAIDLGALQRALTSQLNRRRRMLLIGIVSTVIGLIVIQVLFFANLAGTRPEDQGIFLVKLILQQGVNVVFVIELIRLLARQRRLARGRADSVRAVTALSLASVEEEMGDYRLLLWVIPVLLGTALFSAYLNQPVSRVGWAPFAGRALSSVIFFLGAGLLQWQQYRRKLAPEQTRLKATLAGLDQAEG